MFRPRVPARRQAWLVIAGCLCWVLLATGCGRIPTGPSGRGDVGPLAAQRTGAPSYASQRVIARLKPGVQPSDIAAAYGSVVLGYIPELMLASLRDPSGQSEQTFITRLSADPRIEYAELDAACLTAEARQSTIAISEGHGSWDDVVDQGAFDRVGAAAALAQVPPGDVLVAIVDTGIELDHPALASALCLPGFEPGVVTEPGNDRAEGLDTNGDGIVDGSWGHGTHVAGIVHAMAPMARLLPVRVLDSDGVGYAFAIARGVVAATNLGAKVINMSVGMSESSAAVRAALDYAVGLGVIIVAPAGNAGVDPIEFPAAYPPVFAVAGTDPYDRKASFSDYGAGVDVAAPATGILSTYVGGGYASWSGTSMAAPFASGAAALLYGALGPRSAAAAQRIETSLLAGAQPLGAIDPSFGSALGAGRLSAIGAALALGAGSGSGPLHDPAPIVIPTEQTR